MFSNDVFGWGVILHVLVRVGAYYDRMGKNEISPSFILLVGELQDGRHHFLRHLVDSIRRTHQLVALGAL